MMLLGCLCHISVNLIFGGFLVPRNICSFTSCLFAASLGATKSSLLSAPSIVSMFVPAPEEFTDEQPTVMTDK